MPMLKTEAITLLGGTPSEAARRIGIKPQAVSDWPDALSPAIEDRVIAALARQRLPSLVQDALRAANDTPQAAQAGQG